MSNSWPAPTLLPCGQYCHEENPFIFWIAVSRMFSLPCRVQNGREVGHLSICLHLAWPPRSDSLLAQTPTWLSPSWPFLSPSDQLSQEPRSSVSACQTERLQLCHWSPCGQLLLTLASPAEAPSRCSLTASAPATLLLRRVGYVGVLLFSGFS